MPERVLWYCNRPARHADAAIGGASLILSMTFFCIYLSIVVIIRSVELGKTRVVPDGRLVSVLWGQWMNCAAYPHRFRVFLSFHHKQALMRHLSTCCAAVFQCGAGPAESCSYSSRIIWLSVSNSSRSSRLSCIFFSTLVTEYMTVVWSRLNFFPMSL